MRLKAIRGYAAVFAVILAGSGCQADGETVPVRNAGIPLVSTEPRPVLLAAVDVPRSEATAGPTSTNSALGTNAASTNFAVVTNAAPAAVAEISTNTPTPTLTDTNAVAFATNTNAPVITEEIPAARPANLKISEATEKVIQLTEASLDEKVVLTFVEQTPTKFELDADEIVYLSDLGIPSTVIAAMLKHDGEDPSKAESLTAAPDTESIQPAIPADTNLPSAIAQAGPAPQPQPQEIEVTTNYVPNPNQQVVVQQQPQTVVVEQPQTVVYAQPETVTYFYDSLAPYGSWFHVADYGWCWQPTVAVVDRGWRPYGPRGRWQWTNAGWYWHSDYTWGWAPFHYGRWHHYSSRGWIWVPDRTWGPAWVSWRSYGDYCGWAPLPPHAVYRPGFGFSYFGRGVDVSFGFGLGYDSYCFAPVSRFHHRRVWDHCLPRHEVRRVFPHSHVANRWEHRRDRDGHRGHFVNRHSVERTERGVQPAAIRTMSESDRQRFGNRERVERGARQTVIHTPPPPPAATVASRTSPTRSGAAGPAAQPNSIDPARRERPSREIVTSRPGSISRPSALQGNAAPTASTQPRIIDPAARIDRTPTRSPAATSPRTFTGTARPITTTPAPATTTPAPVRSLPRPITGNAGISAPVASPPSPHRAANPASQPTTINPATRRSFDRVTPLPGSPTANTPPPRSVGSADPVQTRRDFGRSPTPQVATPAPAPTRITPSVTPQISPSSRLSSPVASAPTPARPIHVPSTPAPTRITPSAPTYSAPPVRSSPGPIHTPSAPPISRTPAMSAPPIHRAPAMSAPAPVHRAPAVSAPAPRPSVSQAPISRGDSFRSAGPPNRIDPGARGGRGGRE